MNENELDRKIRAAIRRDPHVAAICSLLGVTITEFLDGTGPVDEAELDDDVKALRSSALELRAEALRESLSEDLVDDSLVDHSARALEAVGAQL